MKLHVKKGDMVKVIAGSSKGKTGRILLVDTEKSRAVVEGANIITKHSKPNAKNPQGGIIKTEAPIHISNLMLIDHQGNPTRIGRRVDEKTNRLVRYSKKSGEVIK